MMCGSQLTKYEVVLHSSNDQSSQGFIPTSARRIGLRRECSKTHVRVLVTGAAGFIGSTTAELLLAKGHEVVALDSLISGQAENVPTKATFIEGDCGNAELVRSLGSFDACLHFAGRIEPALSVKNPEVFFANNVGSTFRLLEALVESGVERVVFSSSAAVYGDQTEMPIVEGSSTDPKSPYGQSKLMVEEGLHWLVDSGRLRAASLRYFNAAGGTPEHPELHRPEIHLIPLALDVVAGQSPYLEIFGVDYSTPDGTCIRDYVHVRDLASAHVLAITALDEHPELVLNLGAGVGYSNLEVVDTIRRVTNVDLEVRSAARRPGDPPVAVASNQLAREILGWDLENSALDVIVADAWAAYQRP
jgi:UDP-glucose 4-epimerase